MNAKSKMKVLHNESAIEMNKTFAKMVENPFSEEYAFLQKIRQDYPQYKVRVREIKKNPMKETYAGLTYQYMEDYIRSHKSELLEIFYELRGLDKDGKKVGMAAAATYGEIKMWFLTQFSEIEKMGEKVNKIIEETRKAREAMKAAA